MLGNSPPEVRDRTLDAGRVSEPGMQSTGHAPYGRTRSVSLHKLFQDHFYGHEGPTMRGMQEGSLLGALSTRNHQVHEMRWWMQAQELRQMCPVPIMVGQRGTNPDQKKRPQ